MIAQKVTKINPYRKFKKRKQNQRNVEGKENLNNAFLLRAINSVMPVAGSSSSSQWLLGNKFSTLKSY